jgi:putative transposase
LSRAARTPQQLALRARIILALHEGQTSPAVARSLSTSRPTVRLWRSRWLAQPEGEVLERLTDAERCGAPATFSAEQWCQITALACEPPSLSKRPISHWTARELADEARRRGIVQTISERHLGRFLKGGGPQASHEPILAHP